MLIQIKRKYKQMYRIRIPKAPSHQEPLLYITSGNIATNVAKSCKELFQLFSGPSTLSLLELLSSRKISLEQRYNVSRQQQCRAKWENPSAPFLLYAPNAEPGCLTFGPTSEAPHKQILSPLGVPTVSLKFGGFLLWGLVHRQAGLEACHKDFPVITFNFIEVTLNDKMVELELQETLKANKTTRSYP